MSKRVNDGKREYATIVYPESAPENWREKLSELHIWALVSPLHDRDLDDGGNPKKPHYHVQLSFPGKKSYEAVQAMVSTFGGVGLVTLESKSGYARYLVHMDDPEKAQYAVTDVRCFGGADYYKTAMLEADSMLYIPEICDFIEKHDIVSFHNLALYCRFYRPEWFRTVASRSTVFLKEYIKSRSWEGSEKDNAFNLIEKWKVEEES